MPDFKELGAYVLNPLTDCILNFFFAVDLLSITALVTSNCNSRKRRKTCLILKHLNQHLTVLLFEPNGGIMIEPLPLASSLSPSVLSFLNSELHTADDLQQAPKLVSELQNDSHLLDQSLADLNQRLGTCLLSYSTYSDHVGVLFKDINCKLNSFQSSISGQFFQI